MEYNINSGIINNSVNNIAKLLNSNWWKGKKVPFLYTGSSVLLALGNMVAGFFMVRYIIPEELGIWQTVRIFITYSFFLLAGVNNGLSRDLPYYLGSNEYNKANKIAATALFVNIIASLFILISGSIYLLYNLNLNLNWLYAIVTIIIIIIINYYRNYLQVTFRSKNSFNMLTRVQMIESALVVLSIPLLYYFQYKGMLLRTVVLSIIVILMLHYIRPLRVTPEWNKNTFKLLLSTGLPIFILDYIRTCAGTFDRIILLYYGGVKDVGYYSLSLTIYSTFLLFSTSISDYIYPRMSYYYGKFGNTKHLWNMAWKITFILILITFPIAILGWYYIPKIILLYFPKYIESIAASKIMLFAAVFDGAVIGVNALWSMKAWKWMITFQLSRSILLIGGPFIGVILSISPLLGVAYGLLAAATITFILGIFVTYLATHSIITIN